MDDFRGTVIQALSELQAFIGDDAKFALAIQDILRAAGDKPKTYYELTNFVHGVIAGMNLSLVKMKGVFDYANAVKTHRYAVHVDRLINRDFIVPIADFLNIKD
jgi:hypothetical protein